MTRDNDEFAMLFDEIYPNLCRFLDCMLGQSNVAQDVAQETFMRLYRLGPDSLPREQARFWLFRVARNLALNEINKIRTRHRLWHRIEEVFQKETDPADWLEQQEQEKTLLRLLQTLPAHQRASLLLREQEEMSYREIARVLEISESKVKTDIFRARCALRAKWKEIHGAI
jgi:RNA polymerase sigma-70 factor, ECF subfamily